MKIDFGSGTLSNHVFQQPSKQILRNPQGKSQQHVHCKAGDCKAGAGGNNAGGRSA